LPALLHFEWFCRVVPNKVPVVFLS
jgi:hypothetical protein